MDKQKNTGIGWTLIIMCICAVIWNINVFLDFANGQPDVLHIICALAWDACAVVWARRYLEAKKKKDE